RLLALLHESPEQHFSKLIENAATAARAATDDDEIMRILRKMKREAALLIALADIGGVWALDEVMAAMTKLADTALRAATDYLLAKAQRVGQLRDAQNSGFILLAMGKYGAGELNYSSDIDLIVLFDPEAPLAPDVVPQTFFVRITRDLVRILQERTEDGYVFRTDLRLRPDPGSTQVAISTDAAFSYYEREGQTWERAVFIKARAAAGDLKTGESFLREIFPFVWRRYLDHAAIANVHAMKRQMHAFRGHDEIAVEGHNIKLGRGGIREIEFFVQTQQLIAGGRAPELRGKQTLPMLDALVSARWIDAAVRDDLAAAYIYLRRVEHRLQMVADEQTHTLPSDPAAFEKFARFLGYPNRDEFAAELVGHFTRVQEHYSQLFEGAPPLATRLGTLEFEAKENRETLDTLAKIGFEPLPAYAVIREWFSGEYFALKSEAARADLKTILPTLLDALARSGSADTALLACDRFFSELVEGARLFAALRTHPDLVELLALILGTAPRLGDIVAHQPSLLDALLDPAFFGSIPSEAILTARLKSLLADAETEEDVFDRSRRFGREQMVLIGVRILSGVLSASQAGEAYATLADVLIRALHRATETRFAETYGRMKDSETAILALGKLGGREMTAGSDLDLLLLYDFDSAQPESNGERKLGGGQYYARFTKRLISALATPTNEGKLYDVDMRLRPSGRSGPVATSIESFAEYQRKEAWTWEHMALTRTRVVSADPGFHGQIEGLIAEVLCAPRDRRKIAADISDMRALIANEKGESDRWDLKHAAGGLVDLEFIAQFLSLVHAHSMPEILDTNTLRVLEKAQSLGILSAADGEFLRGAARLFHDLTQILRLCLGKPFNPKGAGPSLLALLARAGALPDFPTLDAHLAETQARVRRAFKESIKA
ncbi:MAG TPA: bifunctional [glutamine synthetase] adenylyltransferase/[glutamine synthetase]-adenylyl-L-tyrosine phosphorylase, partial [Xanthobacteraceae bacterium]|nr:bifunctional [glutamine synthetase] adenylyltransferase/[glutamine synthetase]-adenylyl-L-tyrosine phosphorylase [Xanthobacteraceae bacterium]